MCKFQCKIIVEFTNLLYIHLNCEVLYSYKNITNKFWTEGFWEIKLF
jgi:hypothetical protein